MTDAPTPTLPDHVVMQPISSGHHSRAGHDPDNNHFYIDFAKSGAAPNIYRYENFTAQDHADYLASESKGRHFLQNIKPYNQKFPFVRVATSAKIT